MIATFDQLVSGYNAWEKTKELPASLLEYDNKNISITGFIYQADNSQWILAAEPNLKSCCVGTRSKLNSQVLIHSEDSILPTLRAVTVEGKLEIVLNNPKYFYIIKEAKIQNNDQLWGTPAIIALFCLAIYLIFRLLNCKSEKS